MVATFMMRTPTEFLVGSTTILFAGLVSLLIAGIIRLSRSRSDTRRKNEYASAVFIGSGFALIAMSIFMAVLSRGGPIH
jgi:hypothetical protein